MQGETYTVDVPLPKKPYLDPPEISQENLYFQKEKGQSFEFSEKFFNIFNLDYRISVTNFH